MPKATDDESDTDEEVDEGATARLATGERDMLAGTAAAEPKVVVKRKVSAERERR